MRISPKTIGLFLGPLIYILAMVVPVPDGMTPDARAVMAATLWIAIWWLSEAIPIAATSLLPIVLIPLTTGIDIQDITSPYGHPLVFLYVGGFMIAVAIERWGLHRRIALSIVHRIGVNMRLIVLGFMIATAFLSMWISNTATSVMMLPIGMAIVGQIEKKGDFGKVLMLSIAYAASIGGLATLIGTPTNLVLAGVVEELYNEQISFSRWFAFGLPVSIVLLIIAWLYLTRVAYKLGRGVSEKGVEEINAQFKALGRWSRQEKAVGVVFALTALCWIMRSFVLEGFLPGITDTIIAIVGALALFVIPSGKGGALLEWDSAVRIPWGIVLLFGGGLAIASAFQITGLAEWIGTRLTYLRGIPLILLILILIAGVNFLTEITSNVATASMILPILASLAVVLEVDPYILMIAATTAASCAFMLPVATPPNAVVFASGYLAIPTMARAGLWMNLISIALLTMAVYFFLPLVWS